MSELTYTRCGDYYIPDLKLSEQPEAPIGKYGRMRQRYLKEHRPGLYSSLILSEKLYPHLLEIDRAARERMDAMLPRMMEAAGVTEELKARDPMRCPWCVITSGAFSITGNLRWNRRERGRKEGEGAFYPFTLLPFYL